MGFFLAWSCGCDDFSGDPQKKFGPNLRALICGSAPLARETQLFFMMLGIPVLQVYGLTETTAICTMDDPGHIEPGRVGPAMPRLEMKVGENDEIIARGADIFCGCTGTGRNRPPGCFTMAGSIPAIRATSTRAGSWRITGQFEKSHHFEFRRHNIAPEPLEERTGSRVTWRAAGRSGWKRPRIFDGDLVTGEVAHQEIESRIEQLERYTASLSQDSEVSRGAAAFHNRKRLVDG